MDNSSCSPTPHNEFSFFRLKKKGGNWRYVRYPALEKFEVDFLFSFFSYHMIK